MVTIYIANVIEKSIVVTEVQDRLCSSERLMLFFEEKVYFIRAMKLVKGESREHHTKGRS